MDVEVASNNEQDQHCSQNSVELTNVAVYGNERTHSKPGGLMVALL